MAEVPIPKQEDVYAASLILDLARIDREQALTRLAPVFAAARIHMESKNGDRNTG